jgi:hypothetical protein
MLELDVDNLRREVKKLRAELADLRAELAQVRQAKHDASRQGAEDPTEICTFRIVGVSQDCGPIDITVDMPSDCVPKSYAITRLVARGIIESLGVDERDDFFDVVVDGVVVVLPDRSPLPVKSVEEIAGECGYELAYDEGLVGHYVLARDGALRNVDDLNERDDS